MGSSTALFTIKNSSFISRLPLPDSLRNSLQSGGNLAISPPDSRILDVEAFISETDPSKLDTTSTADPNVRQLELSSKVLADRVVAPEYQCKFSADLVASSDNRQNVFAVPNTGTWISIALALA
jgi:hypothetical protein